MTDDESSFRRRRRRDSGSSDEASTDVPPTDDASVEQSPAQPEEPVADLTPWWRTTSLTPADADAHSTDAAPEGAGADETEQPPLRRSSFQPVQDDDSTAPEAEPAAEPAPMPVPAPAAAPAPVPQSMPDAEQEPVPAPVPAPEVQPMPPLFKPRPDVDRPWVTRPRDASVDAGVSTAPDAAGEPEVIASGGEAERASSTAGSSDTSTSDSSPNDSAPFVWSLTPNDELDPFVHTTSSKAPESTQDLTEVPDTPSRLDAELAIEPPFVPVPSPVQAEPVVQVAPVAPVEAEGTETGDDEPGDEDPGDEDPGHDEPGDEELQATDPAPTRPLNADDAASLAFLMELEAATAASSGTSDDDDDDDDDVVTDTGATGQAAPVGDAGRRPVSATSLPASEFAPHSDTELFPSTDPSTDSSTGSSAGASGTVPPRTQRKSGSGETRPPLPPVVKWVALGLAAVLVLVALFFLGTRLPGLFGASAPATPSATPTPTETPTQTPTPTTPPAEVVVAVGPVAPGEHKWNALLGGECLEPYSTPWAETFTVVDCATPHTAQMVFTAPVTSDPAAAYPGEAEIASQLALWCSAPGVLDTAAAGGYSDLQVQGTYPVSAEQWADGERNYSCFLSRSTGEALTGTLAVVQPAT